MAFRVRWEAPVLATPPCEPCQDGASRWPATCMREMIQEQTANEAVSELAEPRSRGHRTVGGGQCDAQPPFRTGDGWFAYNLVVNLAKRG